MAKKPDGLPEILFVGRKRKEPYKLCVFIVEEKDRGGIPRRLRLLLDDESVDIREGMEFITGYIPEVITRPEEERR